MTQYSYSEEYNGSDLLVKVTSGTGTVVTESGTVQTHTIRFYIDDELKTPVEATTIQLAAAIAAGIQSLKDEVDGRDAIDGILEPLGFTEDGSVDQVATPTGFAVTQPDGPGGAVFLSWDVVGPVEVYKIEQALVSDYSDAYEISSGDTTPYSLEVLPPGTRYYRIKAQIGGMTDSEWATASITVA